MGVSSYLLCAKYSAKMRIKMDKILEKWDEILSTVKHEHDISDISFDTWIRPLEVYGVEGSTLYILVPSEQMTLSYISKKYYLPLKVTIAELTGTEYEIKFILPEQTKNIRTGNSGVPKKNALSEKADRSNLNPNYTFDTFVVGESNKMAYAAARAVADGVGHYNPLFIYGDSGLGKTHLIYAIAHQIRTTRPSAKIIYIKGDDFINEFIELVRAGRGSEFRAKYRDADLLLVDDVQFVAGKEQVQNEFFHTFNTLYEAGRQIVLTSDRPPSDSLRTRFEWGLLVDVQPPDFETRLAIVKNKAAQWGTVIDDDIAKYIAENVTSNVRQLEGTMNKILAYRDLIGREMDADAAHRAVEDFMKKNANLAPTAAMIITETSRYFGIDEEVIKGPSRSREAVNARQAAMYLVRRMTNLSTPDIGREFGKRDHTTVLHSLEQIEKKMKSDPVFNQTIKEITININSKR